MLLLFLFQLLITQEEEEEAQKSMKFMEHDVKRILILFIMFSQCLLVYCRKYRNEDTLHTDDKSFFALLQLIKHKKVEILKCHKILSERILNVDGLIIF